MNPTYVNKQSLLEKFNKSSHKSISESVQESVPESVHEKSPIFIENSKKEPKDISPSELLAYNKKITKQLSAKHIALLPAIKESVIKRKDLCKYTYKLSDVLNMDINYIKSKKLINLCIFNIVKSPNVPPIILYLLNKNPQTNILYFPHFYTTDNIFDEATKNLNKLFDKWSIQPKLKGYIETTHNIYIFYEQKYSYVLEKLEYKDSFWWTALFEIINTKMILNFSIDRTVYSIFYKNPLLISLFDLHNNKLDIPYITYYGSYYTYTAFIAAFGLPKELPTGNLGPYYYFYTYYGAGKWAIWSPSRKCMTIDDEDITVNNYGVYKKGGIVRYAVFGDKIKYFLNSETDPDDLSEISQAAAKEGEFYKSTLKVRDVDAKWADDNDIAYIGSVFIKSKKHKDRRLTIQFTARDFYQQIPLTYHYIDTSPFSKIDGDAAYNLPYEYENYNIE